MNNIWPPNEEGIEDIAHAFIDHANMSMTDNEYVASQRSCIDRAFPVNAKIGEIWRAFPPDNKMGIECLFLIVDINQPEDGYYHGMLISEELWLASYEEIIIPSDSISSVQPRAICVFPYVYRIPQECLYKLFGRISPEATKLVSIWHQANYREHDFILRHSNVSREQIDGGENCRPEVGLTVVNEDDETNHKIYHGKDKIGDDNIRMLARDKYLLGVLPFAIKIDE